MEQEKIDVVKAGEAVIRELYGKYPEWDKLKEYIDEFKENPISNFSADQLSQSCIEMAALISYVEVMAANAVAMCNESYIYRKYKYFKEFRAFSGGVTAADKFADEKSIKARENEAVHQYVADILKGRVKSAERLISVIQTRLGLMKVELIAIS